MRIAELQADEALIERVWNNLFDLAADGRAFAVDQVYTELSRNAPDVYTRLKPLRQSTFRIRTKDQLLGPYAQFVREICAKYPRLCRTGHHKRQAADPWVIAVAWHDGLIVVTEEGQAREKIPRVCADVRIGIPCIALVDLIVREGWI